MAKKNVVRIKGLKESKANIVKFINQQLRDSTLLADIGQTTCDQIRNRTRASLDEYKQQDLSEYTKERRDALVRAGNAYDPKVVRPKRSNLSLSGQLLAAISYRVNNATAVVTIFLKRPRQAYKGLRKEFLENDRDNVEIKDDLAAQGREFLFISEKLQALLEARIARAIRQRLSRFKKFRSK